MAEMHGEIMELNERLHRDIATKDKSIESIWQLVYTKPA